MTIRKILVATAVLGLPVAGLAAPELKGNPEELRAFLKDPENRVMISGYAEDVAYADIATVTLLITTEAKQLAAAIDANNTARASIFAAADAAGIAAGNINTSKFSTSPQFGWFGSKPKSYVVLNRMQIELSDADHLRAIAATVDQMPEVSLDEMDFEFSGEDAKKQEVLETAMQDVMQKRAYYEQNLGLQLEAVSFDAPGVLAEPKRYARAYADGGLEEIVVTARSSAPAAPPMTFDEIDYSASVRVTFRIAQP